MYPFLSSLCNAGCNCLLLQRQYLDWYFDTVIIGAGTRGAAAPPGSSGPFQATRLWNGIIHALQNQVEIKRRRQHLKTYRNCFTGSNAVDVVLSYLMHSMYLSSNDLSRLKGVRLCQALMDHKVFEPVGPKLFKNERELEFQDTSNSLYRFLVSHLSPLSLKRKGYIENLSPEEILELTAKKISRLVMQMYIFKESLKCGNFDFWFIFSIFLFVLPVIDDVWKQQTLLRLLQLIDVPILENILESPNKRKNDHLGKEEDLIISNTFLDREVICSLNLLDKWLCAAVECLEYFPDQLVVTVGQQLLQISNEPSHLNMHKKILFDVIAKHYNQVRDPLFTNHDLDIHLGIVELIENGKTAQALEASQLYLRLLVPNIQEELRRLLIFMVVASEPEGYKLQKQFDNRSVIIKTFTKAILQNKGLSKTQTEQLIQLLMKNHTELFKVFPSHLTNFDRVILDVNCQKAALYECAFLYLSWQLIKAPQFCRTRKCSRLIQFFWTTGEIF
uniref:DEP domain containing 4 n=1 Tax=Chelydra serpentina TaxID=8475 RepID=A0A8C3T576_CHESE